MKMMIAKEKETSIVIEDAYEAILKHDFREKCYMKAFDVLIEYLEIANSFRNSFEKENCENLNDLLYRSPKNLIAFSGKRGSGKSSAMLSFSQTLKKRNKYEEKDRYQYLESMHFEVLDPIDPTTLAGSQSILTVVLSRLLTLVENSWESLIRRNRDFGNLESKKNEILQLAKQCQNGISFIKKMSDISDLSELKIVGDSNTLKETFYQLTKKVLNFDNRESKECFLIIQIDDTDCQVEKGYEVMEDIRKYLMIPNIVVLMATDTELLRKVISQHYISAFKPWIEGEKQFYNNQVNVNKEYNELHHLSDKYLSKLLPQHYIIPIPSVEEIFLENTDTLSIYYSSQLKKDNAVENILDTNYFTENSGELGFQSVILRFIFRKTGIIFSKNEYYISSIIPTSLRGLSHMLGTLVSLQDIPLMNEQPNDMNDFLDSLQEQIHITKKNLQIFEEYFLNSWVNVKLNPAMIDIIKGIKDQVILSSKGNSLCMYIFRNVLHYYQSNLYDPTNSIETNFSAFKMTNDFSHETVDELLKYIEGDNGKIKISKEDYYFIFAVRTMLTIIYNKEVLRLKRDMIKNCRRSGEENQLIFDVSETSNILPTGLLNQQKKLVKLHHYYGLDESSFSKNLLKDTSFDKAINFSNVILDFLRPTLFEKQKELTYFEKYQIQDLAFRIIINHDACEIYSSHLDKYKIYKEVLSQKEDILQKGLIQEKFHNVIKTAIKEVCRVNDEMLLNLPWIKNILCILDKLEFNSSVLNRNIELFNDLDHLLSNSNESDESHDSIFVNEDKLNDFIDKNKVLLKKYSRYEKGKNMNILIIEFTDLSLELSRWVVASELKNQYSILVKNLDTIKDGNQYRRWKNKMGNLIDVFSNLKKN